MSYKTTWNLENYFFKSIDDPKIEKSIEKYKKQQTDQIDYFKNHSIANADEELLLKYFEINEMIMETIYPVWLYYSYLSSLDTQDQVVLKRQTILGNISSDLAKKSLFMIKDFEDLGYDKLMELSKSDKLKPFRNSIIQKADSLKYNLDASIEEIIIEKDKGGSDILSNMHSELRSSFSYMYEGKEVTLSEVSSKRSDVDENVREKATKSVREVFTNKQNLISLSYIYKGIVKDQVTEHKLRDVKHVMEVRNKLEQLSKETVDTLLSVIRDNYDMYHTYMDIKAKLLNKSILNEWDRNAPYNTEQTKVEFKEGLQIYLDIIENFDKEFYDYSVDMFTKGRVDVYPKQGKRGGAYAQYVKDIESFVLLNYTDTLDDVLTLAHELGHAIHGKLSQVQKSAVFHSPLSLAETASMFNETLVFENLMTKTKNDEEKISMLVDRLDGAFNTIFRQSQITLFEKEVHESFRNDEELSYIDFNNIWRKHTSELYGETVTFDTPSEEDSSWAHIPHIFNTPFYCYTYCFGNILSLSLYEMYRKEGDSFIPKYKEILKAGGSETPEDLLSKYGFDITKPEFFQNGLNIVRELLNDLEELVNKKN